METLADFVARLSKDVGCYSHMTLSGIYSLKKYDTNIRGRMGVFGWVIELIRTEKFRIDTYRDLGDRVNVTRLADGIMENAHYAKGVDGIYFYVMKDSHGDDYKKAVTALKAIVNIMN